MSCRAWRSTGHTVFAPDISHHCGRALQGLQWEFAVIDEPGNVNAFVAPGGKVVFYTGLLRMLKTKDEVAAVLGHEAAHVVARHMVGSLSFFRLMNNTKSSTLSVRAASKHETYATQGEKLSSMLVFAALQVAADLLLGIHMQAKNDGLSITALQSEWTVAA